MKAAIKRHVQCLLPAVLCALLLSSEIHAQIPRTISYQGLLTDAAGNPKHDGDYAFTFRLYETSNGGNAIWRETKALTVKRGLFSTTLGDLTAIGPDVKFDKPYWLGIQIGNEAELPQRIALNAAAYSFNSLQAEVAANVADGQVVKSINALKDNVTIEGAGGATVTTAGGKITIAAAGSGTGIQGVQNNDDTIEIANPNGPIANLGLKSPLVLPGNVGIGASPALLSGGAGKFLSISDSLNPGVALTNVSPGGNQFFLYSFASGVAGGSSFRIYDATNFADRFVLTDAGYVGIGTTTPNSPLEVRASGGFAVEAYSSDQAAVLGDGRIGVLGIASGAEESFGVYGSNPFGGNTVGHAGFFYGRVRIDGNLAVNGTLTKSAGAFKIDHPLDPANKYLSHSFVESPDMKNIYDGVVTTDANGEATVILPDWFEALNGDFRYQLTAIGQFAQAIVAKEISGNRFSIKTDKPFVKISWQVTGIRHDAYAEKNRIAVEELKLVQDQGKYLHPEALGLPENLRIEVAKPVAMPEGVKRLSREQ